MDRRRFLRAMGAIAAGVGLRAVPVLGETYSELVPPKVYATAVLDAPVSTVGFAVSTTPIRTMAHWLPVTRDELSRQVGFTRHMEPMLSELRNGLAVYRPSAFARVEGI